MNWSWLAGRINQVTHLQPARIEGNCQTALQKDEKHPFFSPLKRMGKSQSQDLLMSAGEGKAAEFQLDLGPEHLTLPSLAP